MRYATTLMLSLAGCAVLLVSPARSQTRPPAVLVPDTTLPAPQDRGQRAHTNHLIFNRAAYRPLGGLGPNGGMTPAQIRSFYSVPATGGHGVIAIIDAYHYPSALSDFNFFAAQFGLPQEASTNPLASTNQVFQVVYASGRQPKTNGGWAQEAALDIEWAHAMAPGAKIVLVEAATSSFVNLFAAVDAATSLPGVTAVSMSWGGGEFSSESSYDYHFANATYPFVTYFASSGDTGGVVEYPACSPNVVAVGGTSVSTTSGGAYVGETGWSGSGGGPSAYEGKPGYQNGVANTSSSRRSVPDVSADADPWTGVSVYDSTAYAGLKGWMVFGGTSVSAPCVAGMVNNQGTTWTGSQGLLTHVYASSASSFHDITSGSAGSFSCLTGWDYVTGRGSPSGLLGL